MTNEEFTQLIETMSVEEFNSIRGAVGEIATLQNNISSLTTIITERKDEIKNDDEEGNEFNNYLDSFNHIKRKEEK